MSRLWHALALVGYFGLFGLLMIRFGWLEPPSRLPVSYRGWPARAEIQTSGFAGMRFDIGHGPDGRVGICHDDAGRAADQGNVRKLLDRVIGLLFHCKRPYRNRS